MKRLSIIVAVLFALVSVACSQTTGQTANSAQPLIEFTSLEFDYGTIKAGADGTCEFSFTNMGNENLILSNVRSTCGCTVPSYSREPIRQGDGGTIVVKYDTKRIGPINKSVTVYSNASNSPVVLRIKGTITE